MRTIRRITTIIMCLWAVLCWPTPLFAEDIQSEDDKPILEEEPDEDEFNMFEEGLVFTCLTPWCEAYSFVFDGETEENGHSYHNLEWKNFGYCMHEKGEVKSIDWTNEKIDLPPMAIREECGKLFLLLPEILRGENMWLNNGDSGYVHWADYDVRDHGWEIPLFDYSCREGDSFVTLLDMGIAKLKVKRVTEIDVCGKKRKGYYLDDGWEYLDGNIPSVIEGLGIVSGTPYSLFSFPKATKPPLKEAYEEKGASSIWWDMNLTSARLYRIEDSKGNVLFEENPLFKIITGIDKVSDEEQDLNSLPIYDLHGHKVSSPQPGGIYIRGGKKFVMPR